MVKLINTLTIGLLGACIAELFISNTFLNNLVYFSGIYFSVMIIFTLLILPVLFLLKSFVEEDVERGGKLEGQIHNMVIKFYNLYKAQTFFGKSCDFLCLFLVAIYLGLHVYFHEIGVLFIIVFFYLLVELITKSFLKEFKKTVISYGDMFKNDCSCKKDLDN